ncbi:MAG: FtsQ-type POTRA domain-containing protein [Candidatus Schekmanbacteria bacterium]|nr:MAG: FtsQ-type POTRA domain-containing protein [Candidatus Schekmanbacteria bacterium]
MRRVKRSRTLRDQRVNKRVKHTGTAKRKKNTIAQKSIFSLNIMRYAAVLFSLFLVTVFLKEYVVNLASLGKPTISIEGNNVIEKNKILKTAGIEDKNFLFISPHKVVEDLMKIPWIKSVYVRKKLPNSVFISIQERKPFAWLENNGLKLIDENGVVLTPQEDASAQERKVIKGFISDRNYTAGEKVKEEFLYEIIAMLKDIKNYAPWFYSRISLLDVSDKDNAIFEMKGLPCRVYLGRGNVHEKMDNFKKVLEEIDNNELADFAVFDLRFKDRVVAKPIENENSSKKS